MAVGIELIGAGRMGVMLAHHLAFRRLATAVSLVATCSVEEGRLVELSEVK